MDLDDSWTIGTGGGREGKVGGGYLRVGGAYLPPPPPSILAIYGPILIIFSLLDLGEGMGGRLG